MINHQPEYLNAYARPRLIIYSHRNLLACEAILGDSTFSLP